MQDAKRTLFWVDGPVPSKEDYEEAEKLHTRMFRNAAHADEGPLEHADVATGFAGNVPEGYKHMRGCKFVEIPRRASEAPKAVK